MFGDPTVMSAVTQTRKSQLTLLETSFVVFRLKVRLEQNGGMRPHLDEVQQCIVDPHSHRQEERTAWTEIVEGPQFLVFSDTSMISLGRFLEVLLVFRHLLAIGKRHPVDSLEGIVLGITKEVR